MEAARGLLCTPRIASAVVMAGPTVPFSSNLRRLVLSSMSEAHPVTYGSARRERVVSVSVAAIAMDMSARERAGGQHGVFEPAHTP